MPLHPIDESVLIDLAHGLAAPSEHAEALAHIRSCPECEIRLRAIVSDREQLLAARIPQATDRVRTVARSGVMGSKALRWIAVAAAAVIIAVALPYLSRDHERGEYWLPLSENEETFLRSSRDMGQARGLDNVLQPYRERNAKEAVEQLTAYAVPPSDATAVALRDLFLASALLNAGRTDEAIASLERINVRTLPQPWRSRAQWVQYLSLNELNRETEARELLGNLKDEPGDIGDKARLEIERMRAD